MGTRVEETALKVIRGFLWNKLRILRLGSKYFYPVSRFVGAATQLPPTVVFVHIMLIACVGQKGVPGPAQTLGSCVLTVEHLSLCPHSLKHPTLYFLAPSSKSPGIKRKTSRFISLLALLSNSCPSPSSFFFRLFSSLKVKY